MKKISAVMIMGFFLLITIFNVQAQNSTGTQTKTIEPYSIAIAYSKTTNIIFPYAIISVDRGSKDVLAQKAKGVENVLQIKAAKDNFQQTNLTVVTADGKLSSFLVDYAEQPSILNLSLLPEQKQNTITIPSESVNQKEVQDYAKLSLESEEKLRGIKDKTFGIRFSLNGLFIHEDVMYFRFRIANYTNINYDIDQLRFYIRDEKKARRTATQEIEVSPVLVYNNTNKVKGCECNSFVFAVPKFTISDKKYLAVQLMEKNGGRHLALKIHNKTLMRSSVLPETVSIGDAWDIQGSSARSNVQ